MYLPWAVPITTRDGTLAKDSMLMNAFWESAPAGRTQTVKRPGLQANGPAVTVGAAQGMVSLSDMDFGITNDTVQQIVTAGVSLPLPGVTVPNQRMSILNANLLSDGTTLSIIKSVSACWVLDDTANITQVTDAAYVPETVPGVVYLDGTYYVMTPAGVIQGSDLEDPLSWPALNFISTDRGIGTGVALERHLNYVTAFCQNGVQFFYDAANPAPGSPLAPSGNALATTGCASAESIQSINELTVFMSKTKQRGRSISALSGLTPTMLSNTDIDRILNRSTLETVYSFAIKVAGQAWYVITLADLNITLAYNFSVGDWQTWSSWNSATQTNDQFRCAYYLKSQSTDADLLLDQSTGVITEMLETIYKDNGNNLRVYGRTPIIDQHNTIKKFLPAISLIGDTVDTTVQVRYSDDDYTNFSPWRSVDMRTVWKKLTRLGSFRRRSFEFLHDDNTPLRLIGLELPDSAIPQSDQQVSS